MNLVYNGDMTADMRTDEGRIVQKVSFIRTISKHRWRHYSIAMTLFNKFQHLFHNDTLKQINLFIAGLSFCLESKWKLKGAPPSEEAKLPIKDESMFSLPKRPAITTLIILCLNSLMAAILLLFINKH